MQLTEEMWWVQQQQKQTTTTITNKQKTNNMNACEDFFLDVTDTHIWAAFMAEYGMSSIDEVPMDFSDRAGCLRDVKGPSRLMHDPTW